MGSRHIVTLMLFFGMANAYVMRTNMSVAIVAMVNHTSITESKEPVLNECEKESAHESAGNDTSTLAVSTTSKIIFSLLPPFLISIDPY